MLISSPLRNKVQSINQSLSLFQRGENSYIMVVGGLNARIVEWHLVTDAGIADFGVGGVSAGENEKRAVAGQVSKPVNTD